MTEIRLHWLSMMADTYDIETSYCWNYALSVTTVCEMWSLQYVLWLSDYDIHYYFS